MAGQVDLAGQGPAPLEGNAIPARYGAAVAGDESGAPPAPRDADRWRSVAPAALLAAIAVLGVARSVTMDQSSWQGASFGMFATYDNSTSRVVHATIHGRDGQARVQLPEDLADDAERLRVVPTDGAARRLAEDVLARVPAAKGQRVVVEVWRLRLSHVGDDDRLRATRQRLARAEASP